MGIGRGIGRKEEIEIGRGSENVKMVVVWDGT
jgi:hypothetical protein